MDATTGTIRVTLEVQGGGKLQPGMFASVYLEVSRHDDALTIPKSALSLESLGDTVYVVNGEEAARRAIKLGYEEADIVEVVSGIGESDRVIVVGQDGLSDGTPIRILEGPGAEEATTRQARGARVTRPARHLRGAREPRRHRPAESDREEAGAAVPRPRCWKPARARRKEPPARSPHREVATTWKASASHGVTIPTSSPAAPTARAVPAADVNLPPPPS